MTKEERMAVRERLKKLSAKGTAAIKRQAAERRAQGIFPIQYVRLCMGNTAYEFVKGKTREEFIGTVSRAIIREAKRIGMEVGV